MGGDASIQRARTDERTRGANGATVSVVIERLPHGRALPLPAYQTPGSAGVDLMAAIEERIELAAGRRTLIPTGIRIALPANTEGQIRPRSGLAVRHGLTVLNAPGTIDPDYRGEIKVCLINLGGAPVQIEPAMRIAQLVVAPVTRVNWRTDVAFEATDRGEGGFGSTGEGINRGESSQVRPSEGRRLEEEEA